MFQGKSWTIIYASMLSVACAMILALLNGSLSRRIELNRENERRMIVLGIFGKEFERGATPAEIKQAYEEMIQEESLALADGSQVQYFEFYKDGALDAVGVPISGVGLWSFIHGYVAIEASDFKTIRRVNFDRQDETPGLGGEIVAGWFREQFQGKSIEHDGELIEHMVAKPGQALPHQVDGISGATITSHAVDKMLSEGFEHVRQIADVIATKESGHEQA